MKKKKVLAIEGKLSVLQQGLDLDRRLEIFEYIFSIRGREEK